MSEAWQPTSAEIEAAMSAALSRPNPLEAAHAKALDMERFVNEHIDDFDDSKDEQAEIEFVNDAITELDENCDHLTKEIIINGLVMMRDVDHTLVPMDAEDLPREAVIDEWKSVEDLVAHSLGYLALYDGRGGRKVSIYHGARIPMEVIAQNPARGEIYKSRRVYIPIDGTAMAELTKVPVEINQELLRSYVGEELMSEIDDILLNGKSLSDSIRRLGELDVKGHKALEIDKDIRQTLNNYITNTLGIIREVPYEISGAEVIDYYDEDGNESRHDVNPNKALVGNVIGIGIDKEDGKFKILAAMPFADGMQPLLYHISPRIKVRKLLTYTLSESGEIGIQ